MSNLMSLSEARTRLLALASLQPIELTPLVQAVGRVTAEPLVSVVAKPARPTSAMDGYAVRAVDAAEGAVLTVVGEARPGAPYAADLQPGQAVRIFTGAWLPIGADHIVIQENATREGDRVRLGSMSSDRSYIRDMGIDFHSGETLVPAGVALTPMRVALAASGHAEDVAARRAPRVAIVTSGDELVSPGEAQRTEDVVDAAGLVLGPLIAAWGGELAGVFRARDDAGDVEAQLAAARKVSDCIVVVGGASVGDYDLIQPVLDTLGFAGVFSRVSVKPGRPSWAGKWGEAVVLGLPGNPASFTVCAHLFLKPLLFAMTGRDPAAATRLGFAKLARNVPSGGKREEYLRAATWIDEHGVRRAEPFANQDSSLTKPFAHADALVRRPVDAPAVTAGDVVEVLDL